LAPSLASTSSFRPLLASHFSSRAVSRFQQQAFAEETAGASDFGAEDISSVDREFTKFSELAEAGVIDARIARTLTDQMGIHTMTEVQRMTINECLDGTDVIAQARTGTGKTIAFLMPIIQRMLKDPQLSVTRPNIGDTRALIISPTRELAEQIGEEARKIVRGTGIQVQMAVGGTQKQFHLQMMQRQGCHILVGTPGRVKDLLSDPYNGLSMQNIQTFVLDEADRLLDIGFSDDIREIQSFFPMEKRQQRQTLMFSATMPRSVVGLVRETMKPDFKFVRTVDPDEAATHESVPQNIVWLPGLQNQLPAIVEIAHKANEAHKRDPENNMPFKAIVFFRSLNEVKLAFEALMNMRDPAVKGGMFSAHPLAPARIIEMSSNLDQRRRTANAAAFRQAQSAILISSDVTARGMDFPNVSHVIQVGIPSRIEDYVHRLGRTGRAGKPGQGWLLVQDDERNKFRQLAKSIHATNIIDDESLETGKLDMTRPGQLSAPTAKIMQMVEAGVKQVSIMDKGKAYQSLMSVLNQSGNSSKQQIVDQVNELATFGWGLETPPSVTRFWAEKTGFSGTRGLNLREDSGFNDRGSGGRLGGRGFGGSRRGRDSFDERDPFGQGSSGRGSFGGGGDFGSRGGYGSSRGGDRGFR
jgi:ATP-dependent RNA helicase MSS116, mitochondrial